MHDQLITRKMTGHLSNGRVNINCLRELARKELLESCDKCLGTKAIVWDEHLIGPFGLFAEYDLLKDHDVIKMFLMKSNWIQPVNVQHIIFLTRPNLQFMDIIAANIKECGKRKELSSKLFHIFFVPNKTLLCDRRLKDLGVYGSFTNVENIEVELYPYDADVLTMEMDSSFRECHLEGDMTTMFHVAKSLMTIQALYGIIPHVYGAGKCAKHVYDLMVRMQREMEGNEHQITSQIDALLLIDREVDLISPLVTQLNYEGLIDEFFGISNAIVKLPSEKFQKGNEEPQELTTEIKLIALNSSDSLYAELRDRGFNAVGRILGKRAKTISAQFDERHAAKTVLELKQFVAKLPRMQAAKSSLSTHTTIAELVKEQYDTDETLETVQIEQEFLNIIDTEKPSQYIEECIAKRKPITKVLKLLCLQSLTNSGFKPKLLDYYKKEILQTYGYQHILTLQNLESVGLLRVQDQKRVYTILRKNFQLTTEEGKEATNAISYEPTGYAPMTIRLAQHFARGWKSVSDLLRLLPGNCFEETQQVPLGLRKRRGSGTSIQSSLEEQKVTLIFFLGGCTYSEISSLRYLSTQDEYPTEYLIATTKIINAKTFISSLMENLHPKGSESAAEDVNL